jgi:hypothetical protein
MNSESDRTEDGRPAELTSATDAQAARADAPRRLRRWSVAELIAAAVPRAPAGDGAH